MNQNPKFYAAVARSLQGGQTAEATEPKQRLEVPRMANGHAVPEDLVTLVPSR